MHSFWFKMTKTTIPHSYNSQTFEQFNGGWTVSTWKWGHEKKIFFDLFFSIFFIFFICRIRFSATIFYFSKPRQIAGQIFFFVFLIFFMVFQKNGKQGAKNDIFLF